ncbi:MAG: hypothetical protein PUP93_33615 [Rhizonema sp. NSF051]|nr:hypothetical protein [Rhizonema sp. NSF051]
MVEEQQSARQERVEKFIQHLEQARQLQRDWMNYGLECVDLYVEDVEEDWLELWGENEDEQQMIIAVTTFLESSDWAATRVRKQLKHKSLSETATELEKCLSLPEEYNRIFAVKNVLAETLDSRNDNDEIDLLDLAENLLERLTEIVENHHN